jgi:hypothetical protein
VVIGHYADDFVIGLQSRPQAGDRCGGSGRNAQSYREHRSVQ